MQELIQFFNTTGFFNFNLSFAGMIVIGLIFIWLGIFKEYEPLLLVPIGFGIVVGNIPGVSEQAQGVYNPGSVLNYLYFGVTKGITLLLFFWV